MRCETGRAYQPLDLQLPSSRTAGAVVVSGDGNMVQFYRDPDALGGKDCDSESCRITL